MNESELQLILLCQKGQTQHFTMLYDSYVKKIYNYFYFRTLHNETAEDLTSLTFTKALEKIESFNPDKSAFSTWLYTIAKNSLTDEYRNRKPAEDISAAENIATNLDNQTIENQTDTSMSLEKISELIKNLDPEQKEIVIMRLWEDLSFKEIAQLTGKTEAACKMSFGRTLKKWREVIILTFLFIIFPFIY